MPGGPDFGDGDEPAWWGEPNGMLPTWYMPPPSTRRLGGWRAKVIVAIVLALLLIEVAGLCVTYGPPIS